MSFKDPSFTDRTAASAAAKQQALDKLRAKPPLPPEEVAARRATQEAREAAKLEAAAAKKVERDREKAARAEARAAAAAAAEEARQKSKPKPIMTEEQRKAIRDARYAARKARK